MSTIEVSSRSSTEVNQSNHAQAAKNASVEVTDWLAESTFDWGSVDKSFHMVGSHYAGEHAHLADMAGINTVGS